jgi:F-type H+-transporting ATPase subunit b
MAQNDAQLVETIEHIPPNERGGGFPPFQKETFASQFVWLVITFVALYLLMSRIALPRIGSILEQRKDRIDGDIAAAGRLKDLSDAAIAAYEASLAEARSRAQTLANETREHGAAEAEAARKALDATLAGRIAEAESVITAGKARAMTNVQGIAADAAAAIVERLIGTSPDRPQAAAAVADVLKR